MNRLAMLGTMVMLTAACGVKADGPPEIVVDRTPCSHCGMLISEPHLRGGIPGDGLRRAGVRRHRMPSRTRRGRRAVRSRYWFHDADDGAWIDGPQASFVTSPDIRTPMGGGLIAYRDPSAAERSAARHQWPCRQIARRPAHRRRVDRDSVTRDSLRIRSGGCGSDRTEHAAPAMEHEDGGAAVSAKASVCTRTEPA